MMLACACAQAAYPASHALLEDSPFLPPARKTGILAQPVAASMTPAMIEPEISFHGVMLSGGEYLVSLHNSKTGEKLWRSPGQDVFGYTLSGYEPAEHRLTLSKAGRNYTLCLSNIGEINRTLALTGQSPREHEGKGRGLVRFESLSPQEQKKYYDPSYVSLLEERGIEVPAALRSGSGGSASHGKGSSQNAGSVVSMADAQMRTSRAVEGKREPRSYQRFPTPRVNTSHTSAERAEMAKAARGSS
ncbi:hypothetical protein H5P28_11280 [Ruficoccus amylovorans]|uniref:Uncharacterized protein n=1 Tax=Ruficoccus amylovorans TaxID=1804625 RepID=A0A842HHY4_9BACT|nr:hypothetical protein [Ruficoccus amylovorans]MBC2594841.1 hypothetical protein [Ruficoccus amylovorans]